ncbi:MAG: hypothetical protein ACERKX_01035 [Anaerolineales bacterium]
MTHSALLLCTPGIEMNRGTTCRAHAAPANVYSQDGKPSPETNRQMRTRMSGCVGGTGP